MFEKYLNNLSDPAKANPEYIEQAYTLLKEYCVNNNLNILEFVKNKDNIKPASEYIHKELPMAVRWVLKKDKIEDLILQNLDFIQTKAKEFYNAENPKKKSKKS